MAATIYVAPRFLIFVSLFIVVYSPLYAQPLSNGSILPVWSLVRTGLNFPSLSGCFYRSSKGMPPPSWHKHGYVCIHLPKKDLTIFNDIEKNPGPPLIINNNQASHLNAFTAAHRSSQSLFVSSSTSHLGLHFANLPRCLTYSRSDLLKIRFRGGDLKPSSELLARLKNASLLRYRGKRSGKKRNKCLHSSITVLIGRRYVTPLRPPGPRIQAWIPVSLSVELETPTGLRAQRSVAFSLLNARSVKNKRLLIKDWVVDNNIDILALTETWLQPDNKDDHIIGELTPTCYSFYHSPRQTRGGGVGILIKDGFDISRPTISTHQFQTFEFMDMQIKTSLSRSVCIVVIYRPPLSSNRACTTDHFMVEFGSLLEQYVTDSSSLLITGDFNLHVNNNLDKSSRNFLALIDSFNLKQHVCSTHRAGHTLDLLLTRDDDQLVTSVSIHDAAFSDHFVVNGVLSLDKPLFTKKQIIYRSFKNFDIDLFISDIRGSSLISNPPNELDDLVALYDSELSGVFNRHVPIKKRTVYYSPSGTYSPSNT